MAVICIDREYKGDEIVGYTLLETTRNITNYFRASALKDSIKNNRLHVENLKLTSDDRLILVDLPKEEPVKEVNLVDAEINKLYEEIKKKDNPADEMRKFQDTYTMIIKVLVSLFENNFNLKLNYIKCILEAQGSRGNYKMGSDCSYNVIIAHLRFNENNTGEEKGAHIKVDVSGDEHQRANFTLAGLLIEYEGLKSEMMYDDDLYIARFYREPFQKISKITEDKVVETFNNLGKNVDPTSRAKYFAEKQKAEEENEKRKEIEKSAGLFNKLNNIFKKKG